MDLTAWKEKGILPLPAARPPSSPHVGSGAVQSTAFPYHPSKKEKGMQHPGTCRAVLCRGQPVAPGRHLRQDLLQVVFEDSSGELLHVAAQHLCSVVRTLELHELLPANCGGGRGGHESLRQSQLKQTRVQAQHLRQTSLPAPTCNPPKSKSK